MSTDKYLRLDGKARGENGIRIIAESPGAIPDSVAEQVFADIYGVTDAEVEENGRRMVASWNACAGIHTDTLEAGVVVVPVDEIESAHEAAVTAALDALYEAEGAVLTPMQQAVIQREARKHFKARLQQNGGEPK